MRIEFLPITDFKRGILHDLLVDAYSFDNRWQSHFEQDWILFDNFFFDNPEIASKCGFITALDGVPIGHISWDPRHRPAYVQIGHNCIAAQFKGNGFGKAQLNEALARISRYGVERIKVTTNCALIAARHNYESAGFKLINTRQNTGDAAFSGEYLDYEIVLSAKFKNSITPPPDEICADT